MKFDFQGPPKIKVKGYTQQLPREQATREEPKSVKRIALDEYNLANVSPSKRPETLDRLLDKRKTAEPRMIQSGIGDLRQQNKVGNMHQSSIQQGQNTYTVRRSEIVQRKGRPGREFLESYWDNYVDSYHTRR